MNGFGLLVLLAATGQIAATGTLDPSARDWGWEISKSDGKLEYIVQISPEKANFMLQNGQEQISDVPPEIAARLSRVVVRVGNEVLPRTPSIPELERLVPYVRQPGDTIVAPPVGLPDGGRYSTIDSPQNVNVLPVNGGSPQSLPSLSVPALPGAAGSLSDGANAAIGNLADQARAGLGALENSIAQNGAGGFLNDARGTSALGSKYLSNGTSTGGTTATNLPANGTTSGLPPTNMSNLPVSNLPGALSGTNGGFVGPLPYGGTSQTNGTNAYGSPNGYGAPANPYGTSSAGTYGGTGSVSSSPTGTYGGSTVGATGLPGAIGTNSSALNNSTTRTGWNNATTGTGGLQISPGAATDPYGYPGTGTSATNWNNNSTLAARNFGNPAGLPTSSTPNYPPTNTTPGFSTAPSTAPYNWQSQPQVNPYAVNPTNPYQGTNGLPTNDPASLSHGYGTNLNGMNNPTARIASNTNYGTSANPGTSMTSTPTTHTDPFVRSTDYVPNSQYNAYDARRADAVLPVLFVLSLVVNFYLGMLIRKLLTRYRSLLSSVRGQAA